MYSRSDELYHYGTPRHSGRYPWGSGENPYQHESWAFLKGVRKMRDSGMTDKQIADVMGIKLDHLRMRISVASSQYKAQQRAQGLRYLEKGYSNSKIAAMMGVSEGTVRNWRKEDDDYQQNIVVNVADALKESVAKYKYLDVGSGTECYMGISGTKLNHALQYLQDEGYTVKNIQIQQLGTVGNKTTIRVLAPPDTPTRELYENLDKISPVTGKFSTDGGQTMLGLLPPQSVDKSRVAIRYAEEGGIDMDGVIQLRRGVEDISLGQSQYAQVRIKVGDDMYLKGMAMYSDNLPDGVDLMFNTNKKQGTPFEKVLKETKDDEDNPFGATVRQRTYIGSDGEEHLSAINIVNDQGDWANWKKSLASQMLSKQPVALAKKQLNLDYENQKDEFEQIMSLTNPEVKKVLLDSFSDDCDSSAVHLAAAALPRQQSHVILPFPNMKENEIYAPNYEDGETVVLIRYPHGGKFEIPTLTVNNKFKEAQETLGTHPPDAVGINSKVAERLSGADFDGDSVLVIPNNDGAIKTSPALAGLKDFDPKLMYKKTEDLPATGAKTDGFRKQMEMGMVSNLITDMTIKGATPEELAAAVRHSMVVIDAEKHNLDWKQSAIDNDITNLKRKYQDGGGASTLISRATSEQRVTKRSMQTDIDPETGEKVYRTPKNLTYVDKNGKVQTYTQKSTKMAEVKDATELISQQNTPIERAYADYANKMKTLGNQARKEILNTPDQEYNPSANRAYQTEVDSLKTKLTNALKHSVVERQAQAAANVVVQAKKAANPEMSKEDYKKIKGQALTAARTRLGIVKSRIQITPKEWDAIQAGAINKTTLRKILANTDIDVIRSYATPYSTTALTASQESRIRAMINSGLTQAQVAQRFGISTSTVQRVANG